MYAASHNNFTANARRFFRKNYSAPTARIAFRLVIALLCAAQLASEPLASAGSFSRPASRKAAAMMPQDSSVNLRVNFQPNEVETPEGYVKDIGEAFDEVRRFGWVREDSLGTQEPHVPVNITTNTRRRSAQSELRLATLIHMQFPQDVDNEISTKISAAWEYIVPNGIYTVTVAVGDAENFPAPEGHRINVEGIPVIVNFVPTGLDGSRTRHKTATATVRVEDGLLTIDARGGINTKIHYLDITNVGADSEPPAAPVDIAAVPSRGLVTVSWQANAENDLVGYNVYRNDSGVPLNGSSLLTRAETTFVDRTVINGETYSYTVEAVDASGNRAVSTPVGATVDISGINRRINFQPIQAIIPTGYVSDIGEAFDATRGFGWVREDSLGDARRVPLSIVPNSRERNLSIDQRLDTLLHMQYPSNGNPTTVKIPAAWEFIVPSGTYTVTVAVGDTLNSLEVENNVINVEGVNAISNFTPSGREAATRNTSATVTVRVTDGRLTIDAGGGINTKLNYVDIVGRVGIKGRTVPNRMRRPF